MKPIAMVITAAALAGLAGCNQTGGASNNASASVSNAIASNSAAAKPADNASGAGGNQAAPQTSVARGAGAVQLDRTYMLGRWTDNGDCTNAIEFRQDGGFTTGSGGQGLWNLEGDRLTMSGNNTLTIRVTPIDQNTITVINPNGALGRSTRC